MSKTDNPIYLGISQCLLGDNVRYNGGHKRSRYCTDTLTDYFSFVPICPEIAIGLGVPRSPIHLVGKIDSPQAIDITDTSKNHTKSLQAFSVTKAKKMSHISGYIFMQGSPSCGLKRVKLYDKNNNVSSNQATGIYANTIINRFPNLPVEEDGRLHDPLIRENFIIRVYIYQKWQMLQKDLSTYQLIEFHRQHKFILLAHNPAAYQLLGKLVGQAGNYDIAMLSKIYINILMQALKNIATKKSHTNVLMHLIGFLKNQLASDEKKELLVLIDEYRQGILPLIVPITLLKHHLQKYPINYVLEQQYLYPYPQSLKLRNQL